MNHLGLALAAVLGSFTPEPSATNFTVRDAAKMVAHWECSAWAGLSGNHREAEKHFSNGLLLGTRFYAALQGGAFTQKQLSEEVPMFVYALSSGPSVDFRLGQIFQYTHSYAHDAIVKTSTEGLPLAPLDYVLDRNIQAIRATNHMRDANCALLEILTTD